MERRQWNGGNGTAAGDGTHAGDLRSQLLFDREDADHASFVIRPRPGISVLMSISYTCELLDGCPSGPHLTTPSPDAQSPWEVPSAEVQVSGLGTPAHGATGAPQTSRVEPGSGKSSDSDGFYPVRSEDVRPTKTVRHVYGLARVP